MSAAPRRATALSSTKARPAKAASAKTPHSPALRHLVNETLTDQELRAVYAAGQLLPAPSWEGLVSSLTRPERTRVGDVVLTGPEPLTSVIRPIVRPLASSVVVWGGRGTPPACDLLIAALPWRREALDDLTVMCAQGLSSSQLREVHPAGSEPDAGAAWRPPTTVLPVSFTSHSVTIGPTIGANGPCLACVQPALSGAGGPDPADEAVLTTLAAGVIGLFVRSDGARVPSGALSLTFDAHAPTLVHRLWTCTPLCRTAA